MDTNKDNLNSVDRLQWFRDAKFGMFIHWGLYSLLAGKWRGQWIDRIGEQIMRFCAIPKSEYEQIAKDFNPEKFDADQWVGLAARAGMKYIVITAKHHDGFAMYHSKCSKYNVVDATPFHRDPMKELAQACAKHSIRLCFYYSQYQDWHHPHGAVKPPIWDGMPEEKRDYRIYMKEKGLPQIRELLTQYGPVGLIWFDTPGGNRDDAKEFADLVHALQPDCLVSPRIGFGLGDYEGFGDNQVPSCSKPKVWETCATMNETWGYRENAHQWKSAGALLRLLVSIVSKGGNYLLNVGPTGEGIIPEESVERLQTMGKWLDVNGEAIYGARGNLLPYELPWGAFTAKPGKLYVHLFDWPSGRFVYDGICNRVTAARLLGDGTFLPFTQKRDIESGDYRIVVNLPSHAPDPNISVLVLDIDGDANLDGSLIQQPDGSVTLDGFLADIHRADANSLLTVAGSGIVEQWTSPDDSLSWTFRINSPGIFQVDMNTLTEKRRGSDADMKWEGGHRFEITAAGQTIDYIVTDDARNYPRDLFLWQNVVTHAGTLNIPAPGTYTLMLKPLHLQTAMGLGPKFKSLLLIKEDGSI